MDYEGKFRDFMVGWLARQLDGPEANREAVAVLYDAVVDAANDRAALTEVEMALGYETAQKLWETSTQWHDSIVEKARDMIEALRARVREETHDHTQFYLFFLNPFKEGCVPDGFEDALERKICWMFRVFYETVGEAVLAPQGWEPYIVVEPSYEDASEIIVLTHPKGDFESKVFVWQAWYKAWHLQFASLTELAEELLRWRQVIEQRATQAISRYSYSERDL